MLPVVRRRRPRRRSAQRLDRKGLRPEAFGHLVDVHPTVGVPGRVHGCQQLVDQVGVGDRVVTGEAHHPVAGCQVSRRGDESPSTSSSAPTHHGDPDRPEVLGDARVVLLLARGDDDLVAAAGGPPGDQLDQGHAGDGQQRLARQP